MNDANQARVILVKAVLWLVVGLAAVVAVSRYARGLGATTALTDLNPWGLWIGFDVLSGVALAAGGFVLAATVYIFRLERYHALVRPAVLTAFLGYVAVALGLMVDLGRPWNIWRMIAFWQPHSPLFEVGWCVMLYLTVLALEFLPVVFEGLRWTRAYRFMRRLTLPLVITGIALSTLHQSSLGTLFLLTPDRVHPLWYSPILPLLFFVSAVGLGLAMVTFESSVTSWLYRRPPETALLRGLTRAAAVVLMLYLMIRLGDLAWRGQLHRLLAGTGWSLLFLVEVAMSTVIPILLFTWPEVRERQGAVFAGATFAVAGFILNRADVGGISHIAETGVGYLPALTEVVISLGVVSAMALIFLFFVEHLPVWEERPATADHFTRAIPDPISGARFGGRWFGRAHLAAAAAASGVVLGVVLLETTTAHGKAPEPTPIRPPRTTMALRIPGPAGFGPHLERLEAPVPAFPFAAADLESAPSSDPFLDPTPGGDDQEIVLTTVLLVDGDRGGVDALFDHQQHQHRLGGQASCGRCHHFNLRHDRGTSCAECHRDMYRPTDTFEHDAHVAALEGNTGCIRCHRNPGAGRSRTTATPCLECHRQDVSTDFVAERDPDLVPGMAPGYREAMHGLCVHCHLLHEAETAVDEPYMSRCTWCHQREIEQEGTPKVAGSEPPVVARLEGS